LFKKEPSFEIYSAKVLPSARPCCSLDIKRANKLPVESNGLRLTALNTLLSGGPGHSLASISSVQGSRAGLP
jgi:hypothetical protein